MALWGTADSIYSPGTVTIDYANNTITGTGTSFRAATVGSVITIGVGATFGEAVIASITDETTLGIATIRYLSGAATPTSVDYTISQKPVYTLANADTKDSAIRGVDQFETGAVRGTKYEVAHGGWVGVHTYVDQHGELRVKSETLVAFSGISTGAVGYSAFGDADDDATIPDEFITINTQPAGIAITTGDLPYDALFSVLAVATPGAALSYQWQYASSVGAAYTNLSDGATIIGSATAGLGVTLTDSSLDGYQYRVVITTAGGASETSDSAALSIN